MRRWLSVLFNGERHEFTNIASTRESKQSEKKYLYRLENIKHKEIILKNSVKLKSDILPEIQGRFYKVWEKLLRKKICYRDSGLLVCIWKSFTINGITLEGFLQNVDKEEMNLEEMWGYRKKRSPPKERGKNAEVDGLTCKYIRGKKWNMKEENFIEKKG